MDADRHGRGRRDRGEHREQDDQRRRLQGELRELKELRELRRREGGPSRPRRDAGRRDGTRRGERGKDRKDSGPEREDRRRTRLDQPRSSTRGLLTLPAYDPDAFGRLSERIARFLGTGRFIVWMTVVIIAWVVWNTTAPSGWRFDTYPFIFLTLMLSLQASYAAPLILLAQNRQDDRDRVNMEQDRARGERAIADTEFLTREVAALRQNLGEVATRDFLRSELQSLLKELEEHRRDLAPAADEVRRRDRG